jgi:hypothetical protein
MIRPPGADGGSDGGADGGSNAPARNRDKRPSFESRSELEFALRQLMAPGSA